MKTHHRHCRIRLDAGWKLLSDWHGTASDFRAIAVCSRSILYTHVAPLDIDIYIANCNLRIGRTIALVVRRPADSVEGRIIGFKIVREAHRATCAIRTPIIANAITGAEEPFAVEGSAVSVGRRVIKGAGLGRACAVQ